MNHQEPICAAFGPFYAEMRAIFRLKYGKEPRVRNPAQCRRYIAVQWFAPGFGQPRVAVLSAEDDVDEDAGEGLRYNGTGYRLLDRATMLAHGSVAPLSGRFREITWETWGCASLHPRLSPAALSEPGCGVICLKRKTS